MFYCDECMKKMGWPHSIVKSRGPCEICDKYAVCNDRPSSSLPRMDDNAGVIVKLKLGPIPGTDYAVVRASEAALTISERDQSRDKAVREMGARIAAEARAAKLEAVAKAAVTAINGLREHYGQDQIRGEISDTPEVERLIEALAALTPPQAEGK